MVTSLFALYSINGVSHYLAINLLLNIFFYRRLNILLSCLISHQRNGNEMI
ncbi:MULTISPECIES: hypothetical protein [Erwinia]|uniref:hypothetical protein n=1 Tax=Erwinia TaxID=551 RepID=UPI000A58188F|nr:MULTISPECIES: hypothetical protein [Erwinia]